MPVRSELRKLQDKERELLKDEETTKQQVSEQEYIFSVLLITHPLLELLRCHQQ